MSRLPDHVPPVGTPPEVTAGDPVECRTRMGDWVPMVASGPAHERVEGGRSWLVIPVTEPEEWRELGVDALAMNWPAEDVRLP